MKNRKSLVALTCTFALLVGGGAASAQAQYPPPPPPTGPPFSPPPESPPPVTPGPPGEPRPVQECASVNLPDGEVIDGVAHVEFQADFFVQGDGPRGGAPGCAPPGGDVVIFGQSHRIDFATIQAQQDGSFRWPPPPDTAQLPEHWEHCARHTIFVEVVGRGVANQPVQILGPDGTMATCETEVLGRGQVPDDRTQVLGQVTERDGVLPFTGAPLILLILWGIALLGIGTLLVLAAYRRLRGEAVHLPTLWRKPPALPPAEVPRLDTSTFRPLRDREPPLHSQRERPILPLSERAERPAVLATEDEQPPVDEEHERPTVTERRAVPMATILEAADRAGGSAAPPPPDRGAPRESEARTPEPPRPDRLEPEAQAWDVDEFVFVPDRETG